MRSVTTGGQRKHEKWTLRGLCVVLGVVLAEVGVLVACPPIPTP